MILKTEVSLRATEGSVAMTSKKCYRIIELVQQATFSDGPFGARPCPRECCRDKSAENIFSRWQGLTPELSCFL